MKWLGVFIGLAAFAATGCGILIPANRSSDCGDTQWENKYKGRVNLGESSTYVSMEQIGTYWEDSASTHCEYENKEYRPIGGEKLLLTLCFYELNGQPSEGCSFVAKWQTEAVTGVPVYWQDSPGAYIIGAAEFSNTDLIFETFSNTERPGKYSWQCESASGADLESSNERRTECMNAAVTEDAPDFSSEVHEDL